MKNWIIVALVAVIAIGGAVAFAQSSRTANVEIRVWESTSDPTLNYISARPEGGSWRTLGTIPLGRGDASAYEETSSGRFRYSDITLAVPLPESAPTPRATATPTPTPTPSPAPEVNCSTLKWRVVDDFRASLRSDRTDREYESYCRSSNGEFSGYITTVIVFCIRIDWTYNPRTDTFSYNDRPRSC